MAHINETITLTAKEGLEINFSRIVFESQEGQSAVKPSWMTAHFTASALETAMGNLTFTEDSLEVYLKTWLESTCNCGVKSFRWVWDKYRTFKAA